MNDNTLKRFERSQDTSLIVSYLREKTMGSEVSYDELSEYLGSTVNGSTSSLQSARHILLKESDHVWDCIAGEGIRRLDDNEIAETRKAKTRKRIYNIASKSSTELSKINLDKVVDKTSALAALSFAALMKQASRTTSVKSIESAVAERADQQPLPIGVAIDMLKK